MDGTAKSHASAWRGSAHASRRSRNGSSRKQERLEQHWQRLLRLQMAAYAVVLVLWVVPIPNPVKLLAVTFHEYSHAIAGMLTGARVFGFAIAPSGSGVTLGIGGSKLVILLAGHIGSCLWGVWLYYVSVNWRPISCIIALELVLISSAIFGWLNGFTQFFGVMTILALTLVARAPDSVRLFFVQLVGSACCLYAPFEVLGGLVSTGSAPDVMNARTTSDIVQLSELTGIPQFFVGFAIFAVQAAVLVWLVRYTCRKGARYAFKRERAEHKRTKQIWLDIHPEERRLKLRPVRKEKHRRSRSN